MSLTTWQPTDENLVATLAWLFDKGERPADVPQDVTTAVLQCTDTFVWGLWYGDRWNWGTDDSEAKNDPSRHALREPKRETLREARIFGAGGEIVLWRLEKPGQEEAFCGRFLTDDNIHEDFDKQPLEAILHFAGDVPRTKEEEQKRDGRSDVTKVSVHGGRFTRRAEGNGQITVTPEGEGVRVREYLKADDTGALRVALTRFVNVVLTNE